MAHSPASKNDELCIQNKGFVLKMMNFVLKMSNFAGAAAALYGGREIDAAIVFYGDYYDLY